MSVNAYAYGKKSVVKSLVVAGLCGLFLACNDGDDPKTEHNNNEKVWNDKAPAKFSYVFHRTCACSEGKPGNYRIVAGQDTVLEAYEIKDDGTEVRLDDATAQHFHIAKIQGELENKLQRTYQKNNVVYDNTYGFPSSVELDPDVTEQGDEYTFRIDNFQAQQ